MMLADFMHVDSLLLGADTVVEEVGEDQTIRIGLGTGEVAK